MCLLQALSDLHLELRDPRLSKDSMQSFSDLFKASVRTGPVLAPPAGGFSQEQKDQEMPKPTNDNDDAVRAVITWDMLEYTKEAR